MRDRSRVRHSVVEVGTHCRESRPTWGQPYHKPGVQTIPEFLERRFSARTRWILSCVSRVAYVFTKVSVTVYAGAVVFQALLPDTFGSPQNAFWVRQSWDGWNKLMVGIILAAMLDMYLYFSFWLN